LGIEKQEEEKVETGKLWCCAGVIQVEQCEFGWYVSGFDAFYGKNTETGKEL
jgi:hypothetical protein